MIADSRLKRSWFTVQVKGSHLTACPKAVGAWHFAAVQSDAPVGFALPDRWILTFNDDWGTWYHVWITGSRSSPHNIMCFGVSWVSGRIFKEPVENTGKLDCAVHMLGGSFLGEGLHTLEIIKKWRDFQSVTVRRVISNQDQEPPVIWFPLYCRHSTITFYTLRGNPNQIRGAAVWSQNTPSQSLS